MFKSPGLVVRIMRTILEFRALLVSMVAKETTQALLQHLSFNVSE
jgi:hypothetical protein